MKVGTVVLVAEGTLVEVEVGGGMKGVLLGVGVVLIVGVGVIVGVSVVVGVRVTLGVRLGVVEPVASSAVRLTNRVCVANTTGVDEAMEVAVVGCPGLPGASSIATIPAQ